MADIALEREEEEYRVLEGERGDSYEGCRCRYAFIVGSSAPHRDEQKALKMYHGMNGGLVYSYPTLFLGPIYWAYRKCYLAAAALVLALVAIVVGSLILQINPRVFRYLPTMIAGAFFYRIYGWTADRVYAKGKKQGLRGEPLVEYVGERGGTSVAAAVAFGVLYLTVALASVLPFVL